MTQVNDGNSSFGQRLCPDHERRKLTCSGPIGWSVPLPRHFFHVHDSSERPDTEGTDLADMDQVRSEAVRLTGEILRDMGGRFWRHPEWTLTVTD